MNEGGLSDISNQFTTSTENGSRRDRTGPKPGPTRSTDEQQLHLIALFFRENEILWNLHNRSTMKLFGMREMGKWLTGLSTGEERPKFNQQEVMTKVRTGTWKRIAEKMEKKFKVPFTERKVRANFQKIETNLRNRRLGDDMKYYFRKPATKKSQQIHRQYIAMKTMGHSELVDPEEESWQPYQDAMQVVDRNSAEENRQLAIQKINGLSAETQLHVHQYHRSLMAALKKTVITEAGRTDRQLYDRLKAVVQDLAVLMAADMEDIARFASDCKRIVEEK
ncbi:uncharacterized protein V1516DRAFT_285914 [Lipomyces oligophaga]|uniref:uncharacterized protein n=1 Tax=Lipomyces oligophaga TaxID=45792 RepID=UPI0034CE1319